MTDKQKDELKKLRDKLNEIYKEQQDINKKFVESINQSLESDI